jgi:hypothetical protein
VPKVIYFSFTSRALNCENVTCGLHTVKRIILPMHSEDLTETNDQITHM